MTFKDLPYCKFDDLVPSAQKHKKCKSTVVITHKCKKTGAQLRLVGKVPFATEKPQDKDICYNIVYSASGDVALSRRCERMPDGYRFFSVPVDHSTALSAQFVLFQEKGGRFHMYDIGCKEIEVV